MAAPVDAARSTYSGASASSHAISLPASASGDFLVALMRSQVTRTFTMADWEQAASSGADASDDSQELWVRNCDGTEGTSKTVGLNASAELAAIVWKITGGTNGQVSTVGTATTAQPDGPNLALPTATDVLWMSLGGSANGNTLTAGPAGYSNATLVSVGTDIAVFGATKQGTAVSSEDPGAWTLGGTLSATMIWTVAIYTGSLYPRRVTQYPVEVLEDTDDPRTRITQEPVEALISGTSPTVRTTQVPVEAPVYITTSRLRTSQMPIEAPVYITTSRMRSTQVVVEVLMSNVHEDINNFFIE